jgi:hypothetical protein
MAIPAFVAFQIDKHPGGRFYGNTVILVLKLDGDRANENASPAMRSTVQTQ